MAGPGECERVPHLLCRPVSHTPPPPERHATDFSLLRRGYHFSSVVGQFVSLSSTKAFGTTGPGFGYSKESRQITIDNGKRLIQQLASQLRLTQVGQVPHSPCMRPSFVVAVEPLLGVVERTWVDGCLCAALRGLGTSPVHPCHSVELHSGTSFNPHPFTLSLDEIPINNVVAANLRLAVACVLACFPLCAVPPRTSARVVKR